MARQPICNINKCEILEYVQHVTLLEADNTFLFHCFSFVSHFLHIHVSIDMPLCVDTGKHLYLHTIHIFRNVKHRSSNVYHLLLSN